MKRLNKPISTSVKFDPSLYKRVAKVAKARGVPISELIRDAVASSLGFCPVCGEAKAVGAT